MRIALGIEYDGRNFAGWQSQNQTRTVQTCVEDALSHVADEPLRVQCAGRTDAGVHAFGQVIHVDTQAQRSSRSWVLGANSHLPDDVSVHWAVPVTEQFHARFSATARSYRYVILNRSSPSAVFDRLATWEHRPLDTIAMRRAAACLVGEHDFSAFRAQGCQAKSPMRTIKRLEILRRGQLILIEVEANAFLQHMVRNIAGVLVAIGSGKAQCDWARQVLDSRDRTSGGVTAPAHGLYLMAVSYPPEFELPQAVKWDCTFDSQI